MVILNVPGGLCLTSEHPPPGGDFIHFQMVLCRSAIFFPLALSSLRVSRFLEDGETLAVGSAWYLGHWLCVVCAVGTCHPCNASGRF